MYQYSLDDPFWLWDQRIELVPFLEADELYLAMNKQMHVEVGVEV